MHALQERGTTPTPLEMTVSQEENSVNPGAALAVRRPTLRRRSFRRAKEELQSAVSDSWDCSNVCLQLRRGGRIGIDA